MCRTPSRLVLCRPRPCWSAGRASVVRKGNAHTRRLQGTRTHSLIDTHFRPKPRMTCFWLARPASRSQPLALIFRPERRSTVSSAPSTLVAPAGISHVISHPHSMRPAWRVDHVARFKPRWSFVKRRSVAKPSTRTAAVTGRVLGAKIAPSSHNCAWHHTRRETSAAKGAHTRMIASGRGGMACPPSRA
jgi:hypothetical protein